MKAFLMHPYSRTLGTLLLMAVIVVPLSDAFARSNENVASVATQAELKAKYTAATAAGDKIRILVMPGHEPGFGGAEYQGLHERELNVEIADQLAQYLRQNPRFEVIVARDNDEWNENLDGYFESQWDEIEDFVTDKKKEMKREIRRGNVELRDDENQVDHAAAPTDTALRLYGINKWANENDIDLVVHLHINDTTDHGADAPSAYSGYAVYVPDNQFDNSKTSVALGEDIASELSRLSATSTLDIENKGVVEDQELIAIGANNTLSVPSVLVEYGYITEPRFQHLDTRALITKDYALATYRGIQDFFGDRLSMTYASAALPFTFASSSLATVGSSSPGTYALQAALHSINLYPTFASTTPENARLMAPTLTSCPIDGVMGPCTTNAIEAFQTSKGFGTTGTLGPKTAAALNAQFSSQPVAATSGCALSQKDIVAIGQHDLGADGDITRLQKLLSTDATVYPQKLVTGYYGPLTQAAVQAFQSAQGVAKKGEAGYGLVGPKTRAALQATYCKVGSNHNLPASSFMR
jgi:peptidoglycan hydrolase-like protein with peptidoglycan-binding domain/N-acetylmuramoyl-L-alanine amidase